MRRSTYARWHAEAPTLNDPEELPHSLMRPSSGSGRWVDGHMHDLRVTFFGDSFVAGVGDSTGLGWVGRVVAGAFAAGIPLTAYNLGVRRDTSTDVLRRWQAEAQPRAPRDADCRVVFSFGANDATAENGRPRVSAHESAANLFRAGTEAAQLRLPVLIVGPPPAGDAEQLARIEQLSESFARVAKGQNTPYVDVARPLRDASVWIEEARAGDGAHPGSDGYALIAKLIMNPWLTWLSADGAAATSL